LVSSPGYGATLPQFFRLLIGPGEADSNLPQLLRGHSGFVAESRRCTPTALMARTPVRYTSVDPQHSGLQSRADLRPGGGGG
jgi:hypothetical protein